METDEKLHLPSAAFFALPFDWKKVMVEWNRKHGGRK